MTTPVGIPMLVVAKHTIFDSMGNFGKLPFHGDIYSSTNVTTVIFPVNVIEQLMAWSGMALKMEKLLSFKLYISRFWDIILLASAAICKNGGVTARQPGPTLEADTWDEIVEAMMEVALTTLERVDQRVTQLDTTVRQRTEEFQVRFEEAHDDQEILRARFNTLFRDRPYHRHTAMALDREVIYARIAWTGSKERSAAIEAHTQLTTSLGRIETLEARDLEPQDRPAEAGSSC
ncbi:hypothetical protein Tco_1348138 [Tanacetum coccineum]